MSELVHNFESQVVFSNRKNNISANEPITFTIAPSGDNNYFDLNASYLTLTLEAVTSAAVTEKTVCNVKCLKNMSGLINNSKVTYTLWNDGNLETITLNSDNENSGMHRSILGALRDAKKEHLVAEGLKEFSFIQDTTIAEADVGKDTNKLQRAGKDCMFYNYLKFDFLAGSSSATKTIVIPFKDVLEGCSTKRFLNLTQMDVEMYPQDASNFFDNYSALKTAGGKQNVQIFMKDCKAYIHSYVCDNSDFFDKDDTKLVKDTIQVKTFLIKDGINNCDDRIIYNFPAKYVFIYFTDKSNNFSKLLDVKLNRISLLMSGEQKRTFIPDYTSTPDQRDIRLWEYLEYIVNTNNESDYETLLTYRSYVNQFRIIAFPLCEFFAQKATNNLNFEVDIKNKPADVTDMNMHVVLVRSD